ncbi:MAG: succinylglutamate desuccinylase/aspartoacylase family protein [Acidimicrobiia bacterium]|nr:succinylglutamate desuccinylase/aspartoacylase family protein [Acidimicrobiia bacterium]
MTGMRGAMAIGGHSVAAGTRMRLELPLAKLFSGAPVTLPLLVLHGHDDGPTVWLSGAVHGNELCGVEIIRQVVGGLDPTQLAGTVIAAPVVNVFGFNTGDRYLPDRRDLNRSFPGSPRGSLAARVAHLLMTEVVGRCSVGIDLHTGSDHRINLPQIRADLDDPRVLELARAFAPPLALHARTRDGSLRQAASDAGATVLLYEGGEAFRFDKTSIAAGTDGVRRVLAALDMTGPADPPTAGTVLARSSRWMRAPRSGVLHIRVDLGSRVQQGQLIAEIMGPFGTVVARVTARNAGIVIGYRQHPLVSQGDAIAHIAEPVDE